jgi:uncharacterized protein
MRIELRSDSVVLEGYVNVTQRESRLLPSPRGRFVEEIAPKTFERALMKSDSVDLLFNHDRSRKLGSTKEGTLELREDNVGLKAKATVYDEAVIEKARKGELRGWSFGFAALKDTWKNREDGIQKRVVEELELYEVSVLDKTPAYIATSLESRGEEESRLTEMRVEEFEAEIEDNSDLDENNSDSDEKDNESENEENPKIPQESYYKLLEREITVLQIKGGF